MSQRRIAQVACSRVFFLKLCLRTNYVSIRQATSGAELPRNVQLACSLRHPSENLKIETLNLDAACLVLAYSGCRTQSGSLPDAKIGQRQGQRCHGAAGRWLYRLASVYSARIVRFHALRRSTWTHTTLMIYQLSLHSLLLLKDILPNTNPTSHLFFTTNGPFHSVHISVSVNDPFQFQRALTRL